MTTIELIERGVGYNCLSDAYDLGRADAIDDLIEELLKYKSKDEYPVMCFDEFTIRMLAEKVKKAGVKND